MATRIETSGVPSQIGDMPTPADAAAVVESIVTPEPPASSFGDMVSRIMDGLIEEAVIVVCALTRRVFGGSGSSASGIKTELASHYATANDIITLTPDADQTGVSLTWAKSGGSAVGSEITAVVDAIVTAAKPKRSVSSIVSAFLSKSWDGPIPTVVIDQTTGVVKIYKNATDPEATAAEANLTESLDGLGGLIALNLTGSDNEVSQPTEKLVFEGGATS